MNIDLIDEILDEHAETIGDDFKGYRNHVHRMTKFCLALGDFDEDAAKKITIAGCFHDIGLWTGPTFDYLPPSISAAEDYLTKSGQVEWLPEIREMIDQHHKIRRVNNSELVEVFRKGDLVDFSLGLIKCGLPSDYVSSVRRQFPNDSFHPMLVRRVASWVCRHPLNPLPVLKF